MLVAEEIVFSDDSVQRQFPPGQLPESLDAGVYNIRYFSSTLNSG